MDPLQPNTAVESCLVVYLLCMSLPSKAGVSVAFNNMCSWALSNSCYSINYNLVLCKVLTVGRLILIEVLIVVLYS